ncbi:hypothetical protein QI078_10490 [Staphylococcus saprophyticus]|nr:hypothetical protein [Staphylococcus saprophyticus]MDW4322524.1 hypothetical protein [Staphylococcus saprophyticus]
MKIKTKKQLNLPQLIEWGFNNPELVKGKLYLTKEHDEYSPYVQFSVDGYGVRTSQSINNKDTFTVEVEEEITEDTKVSKLAHYSTYGFKGTKNSTSINDVKDKISLAFYIMNSDRTMTLIWTKENGLVE